VWYGFSELIMQIIFKLDSNQNFSLSHDRELQEYFEFTGVIALLKMVRVLAHSVLSMTGPPSKY